MKRVLNVVCAFAATFAVAGCADYESETDLNPEGPPMVQQVRMTETYSVGMNGATSVRRVFGFGTHPMAIEAEAHPVTSATATGNSFRIIMDELLVGNNIEEIACRGAVDTDSYARVPLGATPDDIARCSAAQDVLPRTCQGEFAVCICENDAGCTVGAAMIAKGAPVGVLDINQDGSTDETRMIDGAVGLQCGALNVPVDLDGSYWNPSGNQQVPAMGGFEALGPAIVLVPQRGLPTNVECQLSFGTDVVDKQGERPCAPANGDMTAGCSGGDLAAFKFKVQPLTFATDPMNASTGVPRATQVLLSANTLLDVATITAATVTVENLTTPGVVPAFTTMIMMNKNVTLTFAAPLAAMSMFRVTLTTGVKDTFGQPLPAPFVITFTTAS